MIIHHSHSVQQLTAEEAVGGVARISFVSVNLQFALGQLEVVLVDDLVQGVVSAALELTGCAVAEDVVLRVFWQLSCPGDSAAVASSVIGRHFQSIESSLKTGSELEKSVL